MVFPTNVRPKYQIQIHGKVLHAPPPTDTQGVGIMNMTTEIQSELVQ